MKRISYSFSLLVFLLCFCFSCSALADEPLEHTIVRRHIIEHAQIPENIANEMIITFDRDSRAYQVSLFDFSYPFLTVQVSSDGSIYRCSCNDYSDSYDVFETNAYFYVMKASLPLTEQWEEEYGPMELWDAERNAAFYAIFGFMPRSDRYHFFDDTMGPCIEPQEGHLSIKDAYDIADHILLEHFPVSQDQLLCLKKGSSLRQKTENEALYEISYYDQAENGALTQHYFVAINAKTGICITASRAYLLPGEETLNMDAYWSEVYEYELQDDGSYMRVEREK